MAGIRAVQDRLVSGRLIVSPVCENLIRGLQSYRWKPGKDEPINIADDEVDALRYGVAWWDAHMAPTVKDADLVTEPVEEGVF